MIISIIAAVAENNVIGKDNDLIWHMPADLKFFKETTSGHHIIMGRKTFESFGKPLPNRTHIIITRNKKYSFPGVYVVHSLENAIKKVKEEVNDEAFILGGAEIYQQSIGIADRLYITEIKSEFKGDAFFPEIDKNKWMEVSRIEHQPDERNKHPFAFVKYDRIR